MSDDDLIESIASVFHDAWWEWSRTIAQQERISDGRRARWEDYWIPYERLEENIKEHDRRWARKVVEEVINGQ